MKTVVITGASKGIGAATAVAFANRGYSLVLTFCSDVKEIQDVESMCVSLGAPLVRTFSLDLSNDKSIYRFKEYLIENVGAIDVWINNAGVIDWTPFADMSHAAIDKLNKVNLTGLQSLSQFAVLQNVGTLINVASDVGSAIHPGLLVYSVTKAGVIAFTKGLAKLYPDCRIFAISPDRTATQMNNGIGRDTEEVAAFICKVARYNQEFENGENIPVESWYDRLNSVCN